MKSITKADEFFALNTILSSQQVILNPKLHGAKIEKPWIKQNHVAKKGLISLRYIESWQNWRWVDALKNISNKFESNGNFTWTQHIIKENWREQNPSLDSLCKKKIMVATFPNDKKTNPIPKNVWKTKRHKKNEILWEQLTITTKLIINLLP